MDRYVPRSSSQDEALEAEEIAIDGPRAPFPLAYPPHVDRYVPRRASQGSALDVQIAATNGARTPSPLTDTQNMSASAFRFSSSSMPLPGWAMKAQAAVIDRPRTPFPLTFLQNMDEYVPSRLPSPSLSRNGTCLNANTTRRVNFRLGGHTTHDYGRLTQPNSCENKVKGIFSESNGPRGASISWEEATPGVTGAPAAHRLLEEGATSGNDISVKKQNSDDLPKYWLVMEDIPLLGDGQGR